MTYSQVITAARTDAQRARFAQIQDCYPDDPSFGLTAAQINSAMQAVGYNGSFPSLAVNYYLASGQDLWRGSCAGAAPGPGAGSQGPGETPLPTDSGIDADTMILIFGALIAFVFVKRTFFD